ncbi:hypothetical protein F4810DRAFT_595188 [Camillea tinctor]|nr:hypothetical protein F4810DRAFT_595188 [Camillea tinctor]
MDYPKNFYPSGRNPLPLLNRWRGEEDQQCYHIEPQNPTIEGGAGEEQPQEENIRAPWGFGEFSKTFVYPTSNQPGCYKHLRVFCTRALGKNRRLNLYRKNEFEFELAKYNPLRHPRPNDWNNPNLKGKHNVPVSDLEKKVLDMVNYPRIDGCIMEGPLDIRFQSLKFSMVGQPDALSKFFGTPEIFQLLVENLWDRWEDLGNLFRTSQFSAHCIKNVIAYVGFQTGNFNGLACKDTEEKESHSPLLLISPGRGGYTPLPESAANKRDDHGFPMHTGGEYKHVTFEKSIRNWFRCLRMLHSHRNCFTHIMFRGCEWLEMSALRAIVSAMPNLAAISVHQCFLLHFGDTEAFLSLIASTNASRGPGTPPLRGDFTPMYYGAARNPRFRTGEHGVVPNDEGFLDTPRAVVAKLCRVSRLCDDNDIPGFLTPGTGFRAYLERLPLRFGSLPPILEALATVWDIEHGRHHAVVVDPSSSSSDGNDREEEEEPVFPPIVGEVIECGARPIVSPRVVREMQLTAWRDLVIALRGASLDRRYLDGMLLWAPGGEIALHRCAFCDTRMPVCFFREDMLARRPHQSMCHGCQMDAYLDRQVNAYYQARRLIAQRIFAAASSSSSARTTTTSAATATDAAVAVATNGTGINGNQINTTATTTTTPADLSLPDLISDRSTFSRRRANAARRASLIDHTYPLQLKARVVACAAKARALRAQGAPLDQVRQVEYVSAHAVAQGGWGQLVVPGWLDERRRGSAAASWEAQIDWYRGCWAVDSGGFVNRGPYVVFDADANVADMLGAGPINYDDDGNCAAEEDNDEPAAGPSTTPATTTVTADQEWNARISDPKGFW